MQDSSTLFQRALALHQRGEFDAAEDIYRSLLQTQPKYFDAVYALGILHLQRKHFDLAEQQFAAAVKLNPKNAPLYNNRGSALLGLGRHEEAVSAYSRSISLQPDNAEAFYNRGNAYASIRRFEDALSDYDKSIALFPNNPEAHNNRGSVLANLGRFEEALASFDRALRLNSNDARIFDNRGTALANLQRFEEATASLRRAIALMPEEASFHYNLSQVLNSMKRFEEAFEACDKALKLNPALDYAASDREFLALKICHWKNFGENVPPIIASIRAGTAKVSPLALLMLPSSPADQKKCAELYVRNKIPGGTRIWRGERFAHDRIRIGYVSSDFGDHPVSHLIAGVLEAHDRSRFSITAFSLQPREGRYRDRVAKACDDFTDVVSKSDSELAQQIRKNEIDILVDLNGYTSGNRGNIFALRPAPVQVNYLGYPGTLGAGHIDYIIADRHVIPETAVSAYSEKTVYLPDSFQPNDNKREIADQTPTRASQRLPEPAFVFCSFNNSFKITPDIFDVWMRLLKAVEGSVLWLNPDNSSAVANLKREAEHRGISADRLIFADRPPLAEHLARHRLADLFLDTLYYNAHTTASDALWAGLPVLTLQGETFAAGVAGSLLHAVGLPELVTHSLEDYEKLALQLATQPAMLAAIRSKLASNLATAPLFDTERYTRHLEAAYLRMWEISQKGKAPQGFAIDPLPR